MNIPFERSFASHEKSKYWSNQNTEQPRDVFKCSNKKFWFECDCGHTFDSQLNSINKGCWCPYCANQKLCNEKSCLSCYNNSFASHAKSKYWSSRNTEQSRDVFKGSSNKKYWFDCLKCGHIFDSVLSSISNGCWCPYCSNQKLCNRNKSCLSCYGNSFASHEKSKYWSSRNTEKSENIFKCSNKKYWFVCHCGHSFDSILANITMHKRWCPYCSDPPKKLCKESSCLSCFNNSFASHEKSKYWNSKNTEQPRNVFKSSGKKCWFNCNNNHIFDSQLDNINKGQWCPHCVNKTESKLYENISQIYPTLQRQFKQDWCKKIKHCPYDFCIPEHKIIIELDGRQHFEQVSNWCSPDEQFENDKYKEECANQNDYSVIRLLQQDVLSDRYDWIKKLCDAIEEIKASDEITNIYLSKNNEYGQF